MSRNIDMRRSMLAELLEGQPPTKKQKTAPTAPVSTLMLDAQRAYDEKRYKDAIRHFSAAIENLRDQNADLLHVYDLRSKAYQKDGQSGNALGDAKRMIRLDKTDSRGYLRCAQAEQVNGSIKESIKVCELGLKNVRTSDRGYTRIETCLLRLKETATKGVVYEKGTDPMKVLPTELLDIVVSTFDYRQVVAVMRVSKGWRARMRATDLISQTIDTRQARATVSYQSLKAAFAWLDKTPKFLAFAKLGENAARLVNTQLGQWIRWEALETLIIDEGKLQNLRIRLDKYKSLKVLRISSGAHMPVTFSSILHDCNALQDCTLLNGLVLGLDALYTADSAVLHNNLRSLVIHSTHSAAGVAGQGSFGNIRFRDSCLFPNLEKLILGRIMIVSNLDLTGYTKLKELVLDDVSIDEQRNLRTPTSLESFTLNGAFANIFPRPEEIKMPSGQLRTISLAGTDSLRCLAYTIRQGLDGTILRHLSLADFITYTNVAGRVISSDLQMLRDIPGTEALDKVDTLALKDDNIKDTDVAAVSSLFPRVQHCVFESPQITEGFVSDFIKILGSTLKAVTLRNCTAITQGSLVDWAEARKVEVSMIRQPRPGDASIGRRVRYG